MYIANDVTLACAVAWRPVCVPLLALGGGLCSSVFGLVVVKRSAVVVGVEFRSAGVCFGLLRISRAFCVLGVALI